MVEIVYVVDRISSLQDGYFCYVTYISQVYSNPVAVLLSDTGSIEGRRVIIEHQFG